MYVVDPPSEPGITILIWILHFSKVLYQELGSAEIVPSAEPPADDALGRRREQGRRRYVLGTVRILV